MRQFSTMPTRAAMVSASPQNSLIHIVSLRRTTAVRYPLSAFDRSQQPARHLLFRRIRANASAGINAGNDWRLEDVVEDEDEDEEEDHDSPSPPPLPNATLELLSEILTGIIASREAAGVAPDVPGLHQIAGDAASAYQPLQFCVNCCRPLSRPGATCGACGHDPSRNLEVLGDPQAWVEAYSAQLQQQDQQDQQQPGSLPPPAGVLLAADSRTLLHRSSLPPYPGRPERLQAIMSRLHSHGLLARCRLLACRPAEDPELLAVHSRELVEAVRGMGGSVRARQPQHAPDNGSGREGGEGGESAKSAQASVVGPPAQRASPLCADTLYNAHTCTAALLAAGAAADLGRALAAGRARTALAVLRPPGAQAGSDLARGGCYLNNIAVAAAAALAAGVQRVMIVDWDVHHGRGTQEIFADDPRVMVVSMHRYDSDTYPGSGAVDEVGEGAGEGTTLNVAFGGPGLVDGDLVSTALHVVLPLAYQFRPQVVLVTAGFGALKGDPIGGCNCSPAVFAQLTHMLSGVAPLGLGLLLEGGYNLSATAEAVEGCLRVLLGESPPPLPGPWGTTSAGWVAIMNTLQVHSQFWSALHPLSFNGWIGAINNQKKLRKEEQEAPPLPRQQEPSPASAASGSTDGWEADMAGGGRDDDDDPDGDDGLGMETLAQVAETLRMRREGAGREWIGDLGDGVAPGSELVAEELHDPRDIDPAELLDAFLGPVDDSNSDDSGSRVEALSGIIAGDGSTRLKGLAEGEGLSEEEDDEGAGLGARGTGTAGPQL